MLRGTFTIYYYFIIIIIIIIIIATSISISIIIWQNSRMQTVTSLMDFSQWALFLTSFPVFYF